MSEVATVAIPEVFWLCLTVFLGLCLGSFATALAWRVPRGISIVAKKRSACPTCNHDLGVRDLVPLFSWLLQKGRCRYCQAVIGLRYPLIELATLALCLAFYKVYGFTAIGLCLFMLAAILVAIIDIDLHHKIIPDGLNLSIFLLGLLALLIAGCVSFNPPAFLLEKGGEGLGAVLVYGGGAFLLRQVFLWVMQREALGLGDVKFFAASGIWLGFSANNLAWFLILSGGFGVVLALVWRKMTGQREFPFGPALILAFIAVLLGHGIYFVHA